MHLRWYTSLPLFVLLAAGPVSAQEPTPRPLPVPIRADSMRADSLLRDDAVRVRRDSLRAAQIEARLRGAEGDSARAPADSLAVDPVPVPVAVPVPDSVDAVQADTVLYLGLKRIPLPARFAFNLPEPALSFTRQPFTQFVRDWRLGLEAQLAAQRSAHLQRVLRGEQPRLPDVASRPQEPDTVEYLPRLAVEDTTEEDSGLPGGVGQYADLGMSVNGRGELGGSWTRFTPCDPSLATTCNPSLFPQLRPDVQFGVQVGGSIGDRVHINVDYDQRREFDAANNINVFYQGRENEILQRVEVGDVSIRLPASRFLTTGIPAGNFGFRATGQVGPIAFQTVFAQQKGDVSSREFRLAGGGGQQSGLVQDAEVVIDDADYVEGQFFLLVHPDSIPGAPHIDVLQLNAADLPAHLRPARGGILQVYRYENVSAQSAQQQAQLGYFMAEARLENVTRPGLFRRLTPDQEYLVHSSGGWILLRAPLRSDEALAVAYVTETGDTIGTVNADQSAAGTTPVLRLLRAPISQHQPGDPTWDYELHNIYRMDSSSGVDPASIELRISVGELSGGHTFVAGPTGQVPLLKLFGADEDAPEDRIDAAQIYQPARDAGGATSPGQGATFAGTYVVFPTLQPFAQPPPVPSASLSAEDAAAALGSDANPAIYEAVDPIERESSTRFRLTFNYRVTMDGLVSTFNLGAFGIREASEKIYVGSELLQNGVDYTIDYDIGQITLTDPRTLFAANPGAEIRATWEQKALFQIAPTSVFGLNARYDLGQRGELNVVGLYQSEQSLMNRPQLGTEPGAIFLGGVSGRFDLGGALLDRALDAVPFLSITNPSNVRLEGEVALSAPNPNTRGDAYLDDFEATDEIMLDVRRQAWRLGSRPESTVGDPGLFPMSFDASTAAPLVWQHDFTGPNGATFGNVIPSENLDRSIIVAGTRTSEPAMWLTFGTNQTPPDQPAWRSMTAVLSTTGRDMSRTEFLEFYVRARFDQPRALVFDVGTVSEDAFYIDSLGATTGTYPDGERWGLNILDEEASLSEREVWGPDKDARGLWNQPCKADPLTPYPLGDPRANCTIGNGISDTEDLDGNGVLDGQDGAYFRYVVRLDELSQYLVKDTDATQTQYRLYRIPLRDGIPIGGATEATWRFIKHLRMSVVGEPGSFADLDNRNISLARLRLVGSRWTKRDLYGVRRGLIEDEAGLGEGTTDLRVGPVSRLTDGTDYTSPPGVSDQLADPSQQFGGGSIEFNEKSLRVAYEGLLPGERAEVYYRYPQQPRNFLTYRQARLWAVAPEGTWGSGNGERLVVRVGTDARNFYMFQTPLRPAPATGAVSQSDWVDVVIDFDAWLALRAEAEQLPPRVGFSQDTVWSADSTYALVLEDRARAPNLAAVRELTFAVYNAGIAPATGQVWVDELRLGAAITEPGIASSVRVDLTGDFLRGNIGYTSRGPVFRQLNEDARYYGSGDIAASMTANMERMLPAGWGVVAPLTVTHTSALQDPRFLSNSDVLAERLPNLRTPESQQTQVSLSVRKQTPSANPWLGILVDGLQLAMRYNTAELGTTTSRNEADGVDASVTWRREIARREVDVMPGFIVSVLRALVPGAIERSQGFERLAGLKLRYLPATVGFGTQYFQQEGVSWRYNGIFESALDSAVTPTRSPRRGLDQDFNVAFRPFESLTADITLQMDRDLLDPELASARPLERAALDNARRSLAGLDVGWETSRSLNSSIAWRPQVSSWISPSVLMTTRYSLDRDPSYLTIEAGSSDAAGDSTGVLRQKFQNDRTINTALRIRPAALFDTASTLSPMRRTLGVIGRRIESLDIARNSTIGSNYDREAFVPGLGYQLGWSGFDEFRFLSGDTAAAARTREEWRVTSVLRMPLNTSLELTYRDVSNIGFDEFGGERTQSERAWPGVRMQANQIPLPLWLRKHVPNLTASAGYERIARENVVGTSIRGTTEDRFPVTLGMSLLGRFTANYSGTFTTGESVDPTGNAENTATSHIVQLSGSFMAPRSMRTRFRRPIIATLSLNDNAQAQCRYRIQDEDAGCVPYVDLFSRTLNLNLETTLRDLNVGVLMSYTARDNAVGLRNGTDQFQIGVFAGFNFNAGQLPLVPGGIR